MRELTRPIQAAMHHVARAQLRIPSVGRATLRCDGAPDLRIRIGNLSRSGYRGEASAAAASHVRAGMTVRLVLPFGREVPGTVRWSLNGRFGCQLDDAFSGLDMLALSFIAGASVSSLALLAALGAALWF
jgi:hypothetical protein